jgi:hypothetical protein
MSAEIKTGFAALGPTTMSALVERERTTKCWSAPIVVDKYGRGWPLDFSVYAAASAYACWILIGVENQGMWRIVIGREETDLTDPWA